jgi:hypothetical protein
VENRLVTQAMLYAYRNEPPPLQPGAAYEDRARIANILIGGRDGAGQRPRPRRRRRHRREPSAAPGRSPTHAAARRSVAGRQLRPGLLAGLGEPRGAQPTRVLGTGEPADVEIYEPPVPTLRIPTPGEQPGVVPYQPVLPSSGRLEMRLRDLAGREIGRG